MPRRPGMPTMPVTPRWAAVAGSRKLPRGPVFAAPWVISAVAVLAIAGSAADGLATEAAVSRAREIPGPHIHGLAVDPLDPKVVWVAAHGGLLRIRNGRWERVGNHTYDHMSFLVHPRQPRVLLTSGHPGPRDRRPNPLGVEVSRDGGLSWQPLALTGEADFHAAAQSWSDPRVLYGWNVARRAGLYRSRDGGRTWAYVGERGLSWVFSLTVHPRDPNTVFAATQEGLAVSRDGGERWQRLDGPLGRIPVTALAFHPREPHRVYAYAASPELGLVLSTDGGSTWSSLGVFLGAQDAVGYLALDPANSKVLYLSTLSADLYRSRDGGKTLDRLAQAGRVLAP